MKSCTLSILIALATLMIARTLPGQSVADAVSDSKRLTAIELLKRNCFDCHGGGESEGSLQLDRLLEQPDSPVTRDRWWKVLSNVRAGTMPPPDSGAKLSADESAPLLNWLKYSAMEIDSENPDPGRPTARRLIPVAALGLNHFGVTVDHFGDSNGHLDTI